MSENLVIVESPAKAKTIEKILGKEFLVKSSYGHIRDLGKEGGEGSTGIDIEGGFIPNYEISPDKKKVVSELRQAAKKAKTVWLASDEDREGEAIAWHLSEILELNPEKTKRIVFHEITPTAIKNAVQNPRNIDHNLVNAQQARRILDRLVGFELSPLLWKKVRPSLSAGRVQSVAVKLIVEREREIISFESKPYFRVVGEFLTDKGEKVKAELSRRIDTIEEAKALITKLKGANYTVSSVTTAPAKRTPAAPFTTSTLQQEASRKLGFSVGQTMSVAQRLYEAGHITYMRTDSVNLSGLAIGTSKSMITETFGEKYHKTRQYTTKSKGAQEAHEAIRPTFVDRREAGSSTQEKKLYDLIWKRTVASQMADAEMERTTVKIDISGLKEQFNTTGEVIVFDGFLKLYIESTDDEPTEESDILPKMSQGEMLNADVVTATERFLQRPARYSEAALVKKLEELGIGRPSTYAPTISTVITRGYVLKESRPGIKREFRVLTLKNSEISSKMQSETAGAERMRLFPTDIGMVVTDYLVEHFPNVLEYNFTARVEKEFDEIAEGKLEWQKMLTAFYSPFHAAIVEAGESKEYASTQRELGVDPKTGKRVIARIGRYGPMVQLGEAEDVSGVKPEFAGLRSGQLIETVTLEEALILFQLPRTLGEYEEKDVVIGIGRFGPYVRHDSKFTSLKKDLDDPYTISLERAVELIEEKREADRNKHIATFGEMEVLNGRYGPYISYQKANYRIAKSIDPTTLTEEECRAIIEEADKKGGPKRGVRKVAPKKTASKSTTKKTVPKSVAKKSATKKTTTTKGTSKTLAKKTAKPVTKNKPKTTTKKSSAE